MGDRGPSLLPPGSREVASLFRNGDLLLGCEDEFPALGIVARDGGSASDPSNIALNTAQHVITLATYAEAAAWKSQLQSRYNVDPDWWGNVDDPATDAEGYFIAWSDEDDKLLVVGGSGQGLKMGVMDFVKSLESIHFAGGGVFEPAEALVTGDTCTSYGSPGCSAGTTDAACFDTATSTWTAVDEVRWCPQSVVNHPEISPRMANPAATAVDGSGGTFLGGFFKRSDNVACYDPMSGASTGACCTSAETWMDMVVLGCDRDDGDCWDQIVRLDGLVAGNYTHALDESIPAMSRQAIPRECNGALASTSVAVQDLYNQLESYLDERSVQLVPTVYGLETRTADEPVMGADLGAVSDLGANGNPFLMEGLSVVRKEMEVCDVGGSLYLTPVPEVGADRAWLDDDGGDPCDYLNSGGQPLNPNPLQPHSLPLTAVQQDGSDDLPDIGKRVDLAQDFALRDIILSNSLNNGWERIGPTGSEIFAPKYTSSEQNQFAAFRIPLSPETSERLYLVSFDVYEDNSNFKTKSSGGTESINLGVRYEVHSTSGSGYPRDLEAADYNVGATNNANRYPNQRSDGSIRQTLVIRAPKHNSSVVDEAWVEFQANSHAGDNGSGPSIWIANFEVAELDGLMFNLDPATVSLDQGISTPIANACFSVTSDLTSAGVRSVSNYQTGALQAQSTAIEITPGAAGCSDSFAAGDTIYLSYTSKTAAGLFPLSEELQAFYPTTPNPYDADYWDKLNDSSTPAGQLSQYSGGADYLMLSDLGGESRGIGRGTEYYQTGQNDLLSSYVCRVEFEVCSEYLPASGPGSCGPAIEDCSDMFSTPGVGFSACDCSGNIRTSDGGLSLNHTELLVPGDMYTPWHNGGREIYQIPYGGYEETSYTARDKLSGYTTMLTWWHYAAYKNGSSLVGHESLYGIAQDLTDAGFPIIGGPGVDPENTREWTALAAGRSSALSETNVDGLAAYIWLGKNQQRAVHETMTHFAQYAWQSEWALIRNWELSNDVGAPGGVDTASWSSSGGTLGKSTQAWPLRGQRLNFTNALSWSGAPTPLEDQTGWLESDGAQTPWASTLLRFYADFPQTGCSVSATMLYGYAGSSATTLVPGTATTSLDATNAARDDLWSFSFDVPFPSPDTASPLLTISDCGCITDEDDNQQCPYVDSISLYQGTPSVDFPVKSVPRAVSDWSDVGTKVCKDAAGSCTNEHTFPSP